MPSTWGYGGGGTELGTMAGWGYLTNLPPYAPFTITFTAKKPAVNMAAERPAQSFDALRPKIDLAVK